MKPVIVGAGLAGLCAAHAWPQCDVLEAAAAPAQAHRAVLRFRDESVSRLTGIPFRKVTVRKGIWSAGRMHAAPTIPLANAYAQKVMGSLVGDRSIWNLDSATRFIAPESFYGDLLESVGDRIAWGTTVDFASLGGTLISTAPLPVTVRQLQLPTTAAFTKAGISVVRMRVPGADVFQTVYFPDADCPMYRASITGSLLTLEATLGVDVKHWLPRAAVLVERAFAISNFNLIDTGDQRYGKIADIDAAERKRLLFELTHKHQLYSLGRFATWRNILLDDVVNDISVVKRLMRSDAYDVRRLAG